MIVAGRSVQGADATLDSARRVGAAGFLELAVLFSFVMLLTLLTQPMMTIDWVRAVRRALLSDAFGALVAALPLMESFDESGMGLVAVLPFGMSLAALLVLLVRGHGIRSFLATSSGKRRAND